MSHLHDLLNPDSTENQSPTYVSQSPIVPVPPLNFPPSSRLAVETEPEPSDSQSSEGEDEISPASEDEIDELDEESPEEEDEGPPPATRQRKGRTHTAVRRAREKAEKASGSRPAAEAESPQEDAEAKDDNIISLKEEARPEKALEPAPRRRLEKHDRKIDLGLHDHKAHADCPDTLACLPDTPGRPQHTLPVILRCAILGSPRKRLTIREIYATMESKYPYYKSAGQTWKQSVRHHLSLNRLFERQPRPVTDPGFGSYWTVNLSAPPGTKRPRKRGRPQKEGEGARSGEMSGENSPITLMPAPTKFQFQPQTHPAPPLPPLPLPQISSIQTSISPLSLGPPPQPHPQSLSNPQLSPSSRHPPPTPQSSSSHASHVPIVHNSQFAPIQLTMYDPRQHHPTPPGYPPLLKSPTHLHPHRPYPHDGRPPDSRALDIQRQQEAAHRHHEAQRAHDAHRSSDSQRHSYDTRRNSLNRPPPPPPPPTSDLVSHRKPATPMTPHSSKESEAENGMDTNGPIVSDDEFESEEEMRPPYVRREAAFVATRPSPIFTLPPFSKLEHNKEEIMEHMRQEIASLRRTSAEAVSTSLRLTEQLANANLEVSRSREAVRDLEDMLQREATQRKEAERLKDQEIERRRAAEHALGSLANRSPIARARPTTTT
ncbi:Forkhead box protein J2 [Psilocybe cubensis]|uniref:Fork-head domain-containing protein n=2 Tax=Psilocybe cubensis TaxID=181762 RepID=A0A8H7Y9Q2_PSICU|nr:Forkhead box protein J2 [Psilocybe cubensis]KAH9486255.1 Forkhead box protein J2 [Psilocybe cubensis]